MRVAHPELSQKQDGRDSQNSCRLAGKRLFHHFSFSDAPRPVPRAPLVPLRVHPCPSVVKTFAFNDLPAKKIF